ncbi:hypothetical protein SAMN04488523_12510 [Sulfitobacter brevis]|uniref:Uncharacterized protein n=1 Tax=Sulfitobacter brevis TaxID=74348 RepID=A0A1I2GJN3_9RHOB|nr:hypothetical protein [Sulfitobacter brevis]SFF17160.1 hypothetical protein SAMN04488523_12510 [Sulfitobacter brevis]
MFSPEGFTPLSELHRLAPREDSLYPKNLMNLIAEQPSIYVCSKEGLPLKVDGRILSIFGATYLFIDTELWVVSFERIRRSAWNESHVLGGVNYENPPEIDLVNLVRRIKGKIYMATPLPDDVSDDFTEAIQPLEGYPVMLKDGDAKKILDALQPRNAIPKASSTGRPRKLEAVQDFMRRKWPNQNYPTIEQLRRDLLDECEITAGSTLIKNAKRSIKSE